MRYIIPVASGKGGVGKTLFSTNLGLALAQLGRTVVLIDLDLGGSNAHTVLGIRNRHPGIGHFIYRHVDHLEQLLVTTAQQRFFFIPGDALFAGTANLPYYRKLAIIKEIETLPADFVLIDLGSGTNYNVLDFFLTSNAGLVVTVPETTAILNAYALIKGAMLRLIQRLYPGKSDARATVNAFLAERLEGSELTLQTLLDRLEPQARDVADAAIAQFRPRVVLNQGRSPHDIHIGGRLRTTARKNLSLELEFLAYLPSDETAARAALERRPTLLNYPDCPFSRAVAQCAHRLNESPEPRPVALYEGDDDVAMIADQMGLADSRPVVGETE